MEENDIVDDLWWVTNGFIRDEDIGDSSADSESNGLSEIDLSQNGFTSTDVPPTPTDVPPTRKRDQRTASLPPPMPQRKRLKTLPRTITISNRNVRSSSSTSSSSNTGSVSTSGSSSSSTSVTNVIDKTTVPQALDEDMKQLIPAYNQKDVMVVEVMEAARDKAEELQGATNCIDPNCDGTKAHVCPQSVTKLAAAIRTNTECNICKQQVGSQGPVNAIFIAPCNHAFCLCCSMIWLNAQLQKSSYGVPMFACPSCRRGEVSDYDVIAQHAAGIIAKLQSAQQDDSRVRRILFDEFKEQDDMVENLNI